MPKGRTWQLALDTNDPQVNYMSDLALQVRKYYFPGESFWESSVLRGTDGLHTSLSSIKDGVAIVWKKDSVKERQISLC